MAHTTNLYQVKQTYYFRCRIPSDIREYFKGKEDFKEALDYIFHAGQYADDGGMIYGQPNVILLDLNMPKVNGIEELKRVRADRKTETIPVIVLTASKTDKDRIESLNLGVTGYLVKPVDFENLSRILADIGFYWAVLSKPPCECKAA